MISVKKCNFLALHLSDFLFVIFYEAWQSSVVSLQKFPKDGVKKLMLQMEKQRGTYEEKALVALQKATQEKADALCQAGTLQVKFTSKFAFSPPLSQCAARLNWSFGSGADLFRILRFAHRKHSLRRKQRH